MKHFYFLFLTVFVAGTQARENVAQAKDNAYVVPEGVSLADAFTALYKNAHVLGMGICAPNSGKDPSSDINAMQMFSAYCTHGYCDYVRGKYMKVNLSKFPEIDLRSYNREYGDGAGQKAIEKYTQTLDRESIENKLLVQPDLCTFFEQQHLDTVPHDDRSDMQKRAEYCNKMKVSIRAFLMFIERSGQEHFGDCRDCRVDYIIESPPINCISHSNRTLAEAKEHLNMLNSSPHGKEVSISKLHIHCADCLYLLEDYPLEKPSSVMAHDSLSVADAEKVLDKVIEINGGEQK